MTTHNETPDHPLTETAAAALWDASRGPGRPAADRHEEMHHDERATAVTAIRAAFDAGREYERATNTEDDRPWEPLNKDDPLNVGDEVRQDYDGITTTAVVGSVDGGGNPWSANGSFIGWLEDGTWYVRRTAPELPTEDGAAIVPADGHEYIEAKVNGRTYIAREAVVCQSDFGFANVLEGAWRSVDNGTRLGSQVSRDFISPGTWKVADQ